MKRVALSILNLIFIPGIVRILLLKRLGVALDGESFFEDFEGDVLHEEFAVFVAFEVHLEAVGELFCFFVEGVHLVDGEDVAGEDFLVKFVKEV